MESYRAARLHRISLYGWHLVRLQVICYHPHRKVSPALRVVIDMLKMT
ncbi:hypothetical protein [Pelistega europaea]|nr:hypothetical protein [Pelistega europaea]